MNTPSTQRLFTLLREDHEKIATTLTALREENEPKQRVVLFNQLRQLFFSHASAEEGAVYARLLADVRTDEEGERSQREHDSVRLQFELLHDMDGTDTSWAEKIRELADTISLHVALEENELFPILETHFDAQALAEMEATFEKIKAESESAAA